MKVTPLLLVAILLLPLHSFGLENNSSNTNATQLSQNHRLNLNQASVSQLQELSGIGRRKAEAIVLYRKENGPFKTVDEVTRVKGIGKKLLEKIRSRISVGANKANK